MPGAPGLAVVARPRRGSYAWGVSQDEDKEETIDMMEAAIVATPRSRKTERDLGHPAPHSQNIIRRDRVRAALRG